MSSNPFSKGWVQAHNGVTEDLESFKGDPILQRTILSVSGEYREQEISSDLFKNLDQSPWEDIHNSMYRYMYYISMLESRLCLAKRDPIRILEIGSGYGGLCRMMLSVFGDRIESYTLVDHPKMLNIAKHFIG